MAAHFADIDAEELVFEDHRGARAAPKSRGQALAPVRRGR
jgi:hypothetical protein